MVHGSLGDKYVMQILTIECMHVSLGDKSHQYDCFSIICF